MIAYLVDWIVYLLTLGALCIPKVSSKPQQKEARSRVQNYMAVLTILSILFAVAWIFALIGTSDVAADVHEAGQYIFAVFITLHAIFTLILHTVRLSEAKGVWTHLWFLLTCKGDQYVPSRTYVTAEPQHYRETDRELSTRSYEGNGLAASSDEAVPLSPAAEPEPSTRGVVENVYAPPPGEGNERAKENLEEGGGMATEL